ncbi:MAG: sigma-70 family RNA polymerase sigma factor [Planctomycetaceae bacterium]|nr:sigma-70 family RNA polymerase sigma factor [Planctomycetaceae bacterium]
MHEDDELMLRIQSGETDAYETLVQKYQPQLIGFFFRNIRDSQMAEDLSQDTMLRIYDQSWDYLPRGKFRGWMYRIARNLMIDSIRRQSRDALVHAAKGKKEDEDDGLARIRDEILSPQDQAHQQELTLLVDNLLQEIPEGQRLTFTLHHYSQLSLPEVAEIMESTLPTTKSRLRLAREKLQEKLKERGIVSPHADAGD